LVQIFLTQLAIKRLLRFSPHPTYASALPGEIKTHEIGDKINKKCQNIRDITDSNLEKDHEILTVLVQTFNTNIKWPFKFPAHLSSVAALFEETEQMQHEIKKIKT